MTMPVSSKQREVSSTIQKRLAPGVFVLFCLLPTVVVPTASFGAQQPREIPRIGFLQRRVPPTPASPDPLAEAFRQGLRDMGYIHGKNMQLEHRYAGGSSDRLAELITELVQTEVDILVIPSGRGIRMAKQLTRTIPIVMVTPGDPVAYGFVASLSRPGGNITGITRMTGDLRGKRLELLKEAVPSASRVGILTGSGITGGIEDFKTAAAGLKLTAQLLEVHGPKPDFEAAFRAAANGRVDALITTRDAVTASYARRIADLAIRSRLPSMNEDGPYVEAGGLMSYSTDDADSFRRAAIYVDRILKGAKPAELPVERAIKFELVINLKTAQQIGLTIPDSVLYRADRVIR